MHNAVMMIDMRTQPQHSWKRNLKKLSGFKRSKPETFSGLYSRSVTVAFAFIIISTFNCYQWTSVTTLYSIKIQCRTSPTAEEQNLYNSLLDIENLDYISDTYPTRNHLL